MLKRQRGWSWREVVVFMNSDHKRSVNFHRRFQKFRVSVMGRIKCRFDGLDVHKSNIAVGTALSTSSLKPMCGAAPKYSPSGYVLCDFLEWSTVLKIWYL
jgi:hypothetical protein